MKKYLKILISIIIMALIAGITTITNAATESNIIDFLKNNTSVDYENITDADAIKVIKELTDNYTTGELADILEQYSGDLEEAGISKEDLDTATTILRETSTEGLREILKDIDLDEIETKLNNGEEFSDIVEDFVENTPKEKLAGMGLKMLFANKAFKISLISSLCASLIIGIYSIVVRWIIYKKAGKHGWAAIIPIYKDVVWLKIAGLSPWLLLLILIPIFGWFALSIIFIVSKFKLPVAFGQSAIWGIGIWFAPIIFESVVAFSKDFEYQSNKDEKEVVENVQ